jgi:hypothetical protein
LKGGEQHAGTPISSTQSASLVLSYCNDVFSVPVECVVVECIVLQCGLFLVFLVYAVAFINSNSFQSALIRPQAF